MQSTQVISISVRDAGSPPPITPPGPEAPNTALSFLSGSSSIMGHQVSNLAILAGVILLVLAAIGILALVIKKKQPKRYGRSLLATVSMLVMAFITMAATTMVSPAAVLADTALTALTPIVVNIVKPASNTAPVTKVSQYETTVTTDNSAGYTLSAQLDSDPATMDGLAAGIEIKINNEAISTEEAIHIYAEDTGNSPDTKAHQLAITVPADIPVGGYAVSVIHTVAERPIPVACTDFGIDYGYLGNMQDLTATDFEGWEIGDHGTATDSRDGQEYAVCKLADGHIWMQNNLKLGSTAGTMALTPADTNIASNWTLPMIDNGVTSYDYDIPRLYAYEGTFTDWDPSSPNYEQEITINSDDTFSVDGGTPESIDISSRYFFGYHYNWCAATAEGTASGGSDTCTPDYIMPEDATGDICPLNWRMPRGGYMGDPDNEFDQLNAKMAGFADNQDSAYQSSYWEYYQNWQFNSSFRGVFAGGRNGPDWYNQGNFGFWWSSTRNPDNSNSAFNLYVNPWYVHPDNYLDRFYGFTVRCLL